MITDLMGYVINCSYGWKRGGRDKSKIQQSYYAGKYNTGCFVQSLECTCSPKITSEPQKRVVSCHVVMQKESEMRWVTSSLKSWQHKCTRDIISPVLVHLHTVKTKHISRLVTYIVEKHNECLLLNEKWISPSVSQTNS